MLDLRFGIYDVRFVIQEAGEQGRRVKLRISDCWLRNPKCNVETQNFASLRLSAMSNANGQRSMRAGVRNNGTQVTYDGKRLTI